MGALDLDTPLVNAAGSLGFTPDPHAELDLKTLGAFTTNPISWKARKPAAGPRQVEFSGGVLLHTGHPNPGFKNALRRFSARWERAALPVIVHLLAGEPGELEAMTAQVEEIANVIAVEIGLRHDATPQAVEALVTAASPYGGELPLVARISLGRALDLAEAAYAAGAAAVSLGPPRGALPGAHGRLVQGRIYGAAVFPQALAAVQELVKLEIPVIGSGGIYRTEQVEDMLAAGALAVQVDTALWRGGWEDDFPWSDAGFKGRKI